MLHTTKIKLIAQEPDKTSIYRQCSEVLNTPVETVAKVQAMIETGHVRPIGIAPAMDLEALLDNAEVWWSDQDGGEAGNQFIGEFNKHDYNLFKSLIEYQYAKQIAKES